MNFTIVKTGRLDPSHRPIHLWKLAQLLRALGVPTQRRRNASGRTMIPHRCSERLLWDHFENARAIHRKSIRIYHPDRGGTHEEAARLNSIWREIKNRFGRLGIGTGLITAFLMAGCAQRSSVTPPIPPMPATPMPSTPSTPIMIAPPISYATATAKLTVTPTPLTMASSSAVMVWPYQTTNTISLAVSGPCEVQESADLKNWNDLAEASPTNAVTISPNQAQDFFRGVETNEPIFLTWTPSPDQFITVNHIYYGQTADVMTNAVDVGNVSNCWVTISPPDTTVYFEMNCQDSYGNISPYSNIAVYQMPPLTLTLEASPTQ